MLRAILRFIAGKTLGGGRAQRGGGQTAPLSAAVLLAMLLPAGAQDLPTRFATMFDNTDFPGGDLTPIFNTNLDQCYATCLRLTDCAGFTFNRRNGACFPKSVIGQGSFFEGALSGRIGTRASLAPGVGLLDFLQADDMNAARDQARRLALDHFANGMSEADLLAGAQGQGISDAILWTGAAVTVADSGTAWLAHAQARARLSSQGGNDWFAAASGTLNAATNATLRLSAPTDQAKALAILSRALEQIFRGPDALAAARRADRLAPGIMGDDLARLQGQYGFRLVFHDVDATSAAPRLCATFSEPLSPARDYAPFVTSPTQGLAVEVEGTQLCLSGADYGQTLSVTFRTGLPAASGETLMRDALVETYLRDRAPLVRFPGRGYVLPASGPRALPVETVNAATLDLTLMRVADRNIVTAIRGGDFARAMAFWEAEDLQDRLAEPLWSGTAQVNSPLNRATTSRLPLDNVPDLEPGVYLLRAAIPGADPYDSTPALQWFMVSDLGVTTLSGSDGLHVVVQRLSDAQPVAGVQVTLLAQANRVLGQAQTDVHGLVLFPAGLTAGQGASAPAMVQVDAPGDMAILSLADPEFDLSDRGVTGRAAPGPVDVFLTPDRGAYRPGEQVNLTALARDPQARAIHGLPMTARLLRPDGVEYSRAQSTQERAGGHVFALPLGPDIPRGVWRAEVLADPTAAPLAATPVLVEDFLPERVDATLTLASAGPIDPAAPPALTIAARHLFGAPAAGLQVSGDVTLRTTDQLDDWPGFRFGRHDQRIDPQRRALPGAVMTDADGAAALPLPLSGLDLENRPYMASITATLLDGAARPVERRLDAPLRRVGPVLGIRPAFDGSLPEGAEAVFDLLALSPDGTILQGPVRWQVDRLDTRYQWFAVDGRWNWEPVTTRARVAEGEVTLTRDPARIAAPVGWGAHELRITRDGDSFASASIGFTAGWVAADSTRDTPDLLSVALDRDAYAPGDTARLRIRPDGAGMALVTVMADRVIDMQLVTVDGETTLDLPVTDEWGSGVYVAASLIRPANRPEMLPARAMGLAHASVDPGAAALRPVLTTPLEASPRAPLNVTLDLPDFTDGPVYATLAAVDLGILTLTGFDAPDPMGHFFGKRALGVAIRDIYGRLIDARTGAMGQVRSGGDAGASARHGPVPTEDLLAFFTGPVALEKGRADVTFDLPTFNGTVRVMAVVWSDTGIGQASGDVLVRDPVVVQPSLPRFLTPGDRSRLRLELTHAKGPAGDMALSVSGPGLGEVPGHVTLAEGGSAVLDLPLTASTLGDHLYQIALTTPDGQVLTRDLRLSVIDTDPEIARTSQFALAPGQSFTFDAQALDGLRHGRATLVAGAGAALDVAGLIQRLHSYPYGCTEQIASSIQPLLLASGTMAQLGLIADAQARAQVQDAVQRILTRQDRRGSFGLWGAGGYELWLDAYVTDVLLRVEGGGAAIPDPALRAALANLRTQVSQSGDLFDGAAGPAYALYVLARAGEAAIGDLRYYADTLADRFDTPLSAAHLAAALAAYGEQGRADAMFARAFALAQDADDDSGWRRDYGTTFRDRAGLLALAVEAGSNAVDRVQLAGLIGAQSRAPGTQLSTQEAVWALQAATALGGSAQGLVLDGTPVSGNVVQFWDGQTRTLRNDGPAEVTVTLTAFGTPEIPAPAGGLGYTITRSHFTPDGTPLDPSTLRVGDRVVTVLTVTPDPGTGGGRLMVDDALPAGLEIDAATLLRSGDIRALDWLDLHDLSEATEARSERFLAAVDWTEDRPLRLGYIARAVSPGDFHHPPAQVEDMYRPTHRASSAPGRVTITP